MILLIGVEYFHIVNYWGGEGWVFIQSPFIFMDTLIFILDEFMDFKNVNS